MSYKTIKPKSYFDLCLAMKNQTPVSINDHNGLINSIQIVDHSCKRWRICLVNWDEKSFPPVTPIMVEVDLD